VNDVAGTLLNVTEVAPVRFVPVMTTLVPTGPLAGVNDVIVAVPVAPPPPPPPPPPGAVTVKPAALFAVPPGVVTAIGPVVAAPGTVAVIWVAESTVNAVAAVALNMTEVAPVRVVPVMTTLVPTGPLVGAKDVIAGETVKLDALSAVTAPTVT